VTTTSSGGVTAKLNTPNPNTSDESISGEISYDESSRDDDKDVGPPKKKSKVTIRLIFVKSDFY
jgi:hypothetical protein